MAEIKPGKALPDGTIVYYWQYDNIDKDPSKCTGHIGSSSVNCNSYSQFLSHLFEFDANDGLWATFYVRDLWKEEIHLHPHCTLFDMLYSKLSMKNYI